MQGVSSGFPYMEVRVGDFGGSGVQSLTPHEFLNLVSPAPAGSAPGFTVRHDEDRQALIVTKTRPGFSAAVIAQLRDLVRDVAAGRKGALKFLVLDFAHTGFALAMAGEGFDGLVDEMANLILAAPVISVACARADLAGADLEFALACSMFIGERGRRFSFAGDATVSLGTYGLLAMKLGFVQAERLMESAEIIDADHLHELMLMKHVGGADVLEEVLDRTVRRHNSSYGIYRAQRISARALQQNLRA